MRSPANDGVSSIDDAMRLLLVGRLTSSGKLLACMGGIMGRRLVVARPRALGLSGMLAATASCGDRMIPGRFDVRPPPLAGCLVLNVNRNAGSRLCACDEEWAGLCSGARSLVKSFTEPGRRNCRVLCAPARTRRIYNIDTDTPQRNTAITRH